MFTEDYEMLELVAALTSGAFIVLFALVVFYACARFGWYLGGD